MSSEFYFSLGTSLKDRYQLIMDNLLFYFIILYYSQKICRIKFPNWYIIFARWVDWNYVLKLGWNITSATWVLNRKRKERFYIYFSRQSQYTLWWRSVEIAFCMMISVDRIILLSFNDISREMNAITLWGCSGKRTSILNKKNAVTYLKNTYADGKVKLTFYTN